MIRKMIKSRLCTFISALRSSPQALAEIYGSNEYPDIIGKLRFYQTYCGVLVAAEVEGLPTSRDKCKSRVFGFHIHQGDECGGNKSDPFADAITHYNPNDRPHPRHAGDMPPLFENNGYAFNVFLTDRFDICEILGKTVIIHSDPDDFTTQPSGNSCSKIACGVIEKCRSVQ